MKDGEENIPDDYREGEAVKVCPDCDGRGGGCRTCWDRGVVVHTFEDDEEHRRGFV